MEKYNTMKKEYLEPTMEITAMELSSIIATSNGTTEGESVQAGTGSGQVGDGTPDLVGRRHGNWGDLWGSEE